MRVKPVSHGFTLIELAVVMVILGLLLGGLMLPLSAQREIQQRHAADAALRDIRESLLGYAAIHGHLPCPDTDANPAASGYGEAENHCAGGTLQEGFLPFKSLGLTERDPWGQRWRYRVDRHFANALAPITLATDFGNDSLKILNHAGLPLTTDDERPVAVFYSLGPNTRADGGNADFEAVNGRYQSGAPAPDFDDQLHWLARPTLASRLIAAGRTL
jgi:prepilin-type N-terminal cleavage/methylation domain-containing protein